MSNVSRVVRLAATLLAFVATGIHAGGPLSLCPDKSPVKYPGAGIINLNYDLGNLGPRMKADADVLVASSVALWTNVGTSTVTLGRGPDLVADITPANFASTNNSSDGLNPVVYDTDGEIIDMIFGLGAKNNTLGFAGSSFSTSPTCQYREGRAVINGFFTMSDTTLVVTLAHEIGHLIGLDHTQLDTTQGISLSGNRPLMYPSASRNTMTLHEDDEAAVSTLYPDAIPFNNTYGQISGTFVLADGATAVRGANLWATETTTNKVYSVVSDYLTQNTGFFRLALPAGTYNLRAGTILTTFTGGSSVGPYSDNTAGLSFQSPLYVGGVAMANVTLGNAVPTMFTITPGCEASLTFRIDGTGTIGGNCSGAATFVLNVAKSGTGTGTVTSAPAGINCGATCSSSFASGASVTLTATPTGGAVFGGWSGACTGTGTCNVTMNGTASVTANFLPAAAASEIFPPTCQLPAGWTVPGTAQSGWSVVSNDATEGICSLKSNPIGDLQRAQIQFTGTLAAGNITFNRRVSSETGFDCFRFLVDGMQQAVGGTCSGNGVGGIGASGNVAWGPVSVPVTAGPHTLIWSYEKDGSVSTPDDAAYIDAVVLPVGNPGTVQFTAGTASVSENFSSVVLSVSRTGGSVGAASVNFATTGITATPGSDFTAQTGTLNWSNGESASKNIVVPITNDALIEGNETFSVTLSSPTGATLGATTTTTVTITDNDFASAPDAPTIGAATPGNAQATIAFTPPASNGGSPITGFTATCNPGALTGTAAASPINVGSLLNGTAYTCSVTASNAIGNSVASATVGVTPSAVAPTSLVGVVSRKTHAAAGAFDIAIDTVPVITGAITVEPRIIGAGHTVRFQFNNAITIAGTIAVVDGTNANVPASAVASGNDVIVTIAALADNKRVTFTLTGVNVTVNPPPVSMGFLLGDINNNRSVNASDISAVKARSGQTTSAMNFRFDVNASGAVNASDISAVKARSGVALP